jgi:hypothetical protein
MQAENEEVELIFALSFFRDISAIAMLVCLFLTPALIFKDNKLVLPVIAIDLIIIGAAIESERQCKSQNKVSSSQESSHVEPPQPKMPKPCCGCKYLFNEFGLHCVIIPNIVDVPNICVNRVDIWEQN